MPQGLHDSSEELLIREAIAGDKQAFGRLYELYADQIVRYLFFRIGDQSKAEDMMEVVFLNAWENLPGFGKKGRKMNFRAWLYRIAHNAMVDHHRTKRTESSLDIISEIMSEDYSPGQLLEKAEQSAMLLDALEKLDLISKQVITLRILSGLSSRETAAVIGISPANVRVIQFRALKKLRELIGDEDE